MTFEAVVVDLDGTLLNSQSQVGERTWNTLEKLQQKGVPVYVATGRPLTSASEVVKGLPVEPVMAIFNGSKLINMQTESVIQETLLDTDLAIRIREHLEEASHDHLVYCGETKHLRTLRHEEVCGQLRDLLVMVESVEYPSTTPLHDCVRMSTLGTPDDLQASLDWFRDLEKRREILLQFFPFHAIPNFPDVREFIFAEVQGYCRGKSEILDYLKKTTGIPAEKVIAFGDQHNDMALLQEAGWGVAMANGLPACLDIADEVIGSNDEEAVAEKLERLFL